MPIAQQLLRNQRRRRLAGRALCISAAVFVAMQLLLTRSGLDGGGGHTSGRALLQLLGRASSSRLRLLNADNDDTLAIERQQRALDCLRALDAELRALAVQQIPSVEAFTRSFLLRHSHSPAAAQAGPPAAKEGEGNRTADEAELWPCPPAAGIDLGDRSWEQQGTDIPDSEQRPWLPNWLEGPQHGGRHQPSDCLAAKSVLLVVPFRDRRHHLSVLLRYLHPIMHAQRLRYTIVVAEQFGNSTFNKAKLMNSAFLESMKLGWFDCVIFHDVDLIPTNSFIPYGCPAYPRHNSVSIDKFGYSLPYKRLVGGVLAMPVRHFLKVNGYSNLFWGWGGEDDDMETRIRNVGLLVTRPHPRLARYRMIRHGGRKEIPGEVRFKLLHLSSKRYRLDGLNSLNYSLVSLTRRSLFTHIVFDIGEPPQSSKFYY